MKPFDLNKALQGEPVRLRNGAKAILLYEIPEKYTFPDNKPMNYPLKGISLTRNGYIDAEVRWTLDGKCSTNDINASDIIGMYEEDITDLIQKALKENLPMKLRNGTKIYIAAILDSYDIVIKSYPVFGYSTTTDCYRWSLDGKFLLRENDFDIIGLWEE